MKVWVVVGLISYEMSTVLGVGATPEAAAAIKDRRLDFEALPSAQRERLTGVHGDRSGDYAYAYDDIEIEDFEIEGL